MVVAGHPGSLLGAVSPIWLTLPPAVIPLPPSGARAGLRGPPVLGAQDTESQVGIQGNLKEAVVCSALRGLPPASGHSHAQCSLAWVQAFPSSVGGLECKAAAPVRSRELGSREATGLGF